MKSNRPFAFAGLWDRWRSADGTVVESFTISTTFPNELMEPLHDRMPCILERGEYRRWLEPGDPVRLPVDLLRPYPAEKMRCWPVAQAVGNVRNDDPSLCEPVQLPLRSETLF
jgi:putative SOS response-associated peptidase YedK